MRKDTQVGTTNATIKRILGHTVGSQFKGRKVSVVEVDSDFTYDNYLEMGSPTVLFIADATGSSAREAPRPNMHQPTVRIGYGDQRSGGLDSRMREQMFGYGSCLVVYHRGQSQSVTIYVPELDAAALSVATDALIEKDKRAAAAALAHCGPYAGIAMAVAEAHIKTLDKGASASEKTSKKSGRQLDAEIDALIGRQRR